MWFWGVGHFRQYVWVRRSHSFNGWIPHFGWAGPAGLRYLRVIEYVPPKRDLWTPKNWLFMFEGHYRVWHLEVKAVGRWATKEQAMSDFRQGDR